MVGRVLLHTRIAERQLEIDRLERSVAQEQEQFDVLRAQRAELRSPTRLAVSAGALGMAPGDESEFVAVDPMMLAITIARTGELPAADGSSPAPTRSRPLDQFRLVKTSARRHREPTRPTVTPARSAPGTTVCRRRVRPESPRPDASAHAAVATRSTDVAPAQRPAVAALGQRPTRRRPHRQARRTSTTPAARPAVPQPPPPRAASRRSHRSVRPAARPAAQPAAQRGAHGRQEAAAASAQRHRCPPTRPGGSASVRPGRA